MVRAILAGKKTQTRRIVKGTRMFHSRAALLSFRGGVATFGDSIPDDPVPITLLARWAVGDRLWVRETCGYVTGNGKRLVYRADGDPPAPILGTHEANGVRAMTWKPSIFMRPAESRITLEVSAVRIERLHAITESDACAEGVATRDLYRRLWDSINGKTMPWHLNPFVWVLSFVRAT